MKVVGLLAHYDESPLWLSAAVTGAAKLCDHVIAADGAYALYPGGRESSGPEQAEAIVEACNAAGIGYTLHTPDTVWMGNQVEKRDFMFRLATTMTGPDDWVYVFDADDLVTQVPADARQRLEETDDDVGCYTLWWTEDLHADGREEAAQRFHYQHEAATRYFRGLFRMLPNLRCEGSHYHYLAERDGQTVHLRGHPDHHQLEPFLNLTDMKVQHRHPQRTRQRLETSAAYDQLVKAHRAETLGDDWATVAA